MAKAFGLVLSAETDEGEIIIALRRVLQPRLRPQLVSQPYRVGIVVKAKVGQYRKNVEVVLEILDLYRDGDS